MSSTVLSYKASPTAVKFHKSDAFVKGIMGPFGCLPGETDILTKSGWLKISDWNGEEIAVYNPITKLIGYEIADYIKVPATEWVTFKSKTRFCLTISEEHHMPVTVLERDGEYEDSLCANELAELSGRKRLWHHFGVPDREQPLNPDLIKFAVAVNADGHIETDCKDTVVFGFSKQRKVDRLIGILDRLNIKYTHKIYTHKGKSYHSIRVKSPYVQKTFTGPFWWQMGGSELNIVANELQHWDGTVKGPDKTAIVYSTTRPEDIDFLQYACASSGFRATVGVEIKSEKYKPQFVLTLIKADSPKGSVHLRRSTVSVEKTPELNGAYKYCFETSTGFFVIRQNGQVFISGNSGKSVAVCWEIFMRMKKQERSKDGKRKSRWIIARNTFNELETTTMETWKDWFPEHTFGAISRKPPYRQTLKYDDVEAEIIFLALDKPEDQKKLLSFEVTGVWFNEARQMPLEIIRAALGRVGRYPSKKDKPEHIPAEQWPTWSGILMDTNPPDDQHWWYRAAEEDAWAVDETGNKVDAKTIPVNRRWDFFKQPSGLSPEAENIENLPGGRQYYLRMLGDGKTKEWADVHVHGHYGFVKEGMPVYEGYWNPDTMVAENGIQIVPSGTICVGVDASGRHPAAVFAQRTMLGQWQIVHELCITDDAGMGAESFARLLKHEMETKFPNHNFRIWGDPAGSWKSQNDERTYFDILKANGIAIKGSPGLRIPERLETVKSVMSRNVLGKPALIISGSCKTLQRGMNGGYRYRRVSTASSDRYDDKPEKNRYSDVQDALQYLLCGEGEMKKMYGRNGGSNGCVTANTDFAVF